MYFQCTTCNKWLSHDLPEVALCDEVMSEYTDGQVIFAISGSASNFYGCPRCSAIFSRHAIDVAPQEASLLERLSSGRPQLCNEGQLMNVLSSSAPRERDDIIELRVAVWQLSNDTMRDEDDATKVSPTERSSSWRANLIELTSILNASDPSEGIYLAEVYRELALFEECRAILLRLEELNLSDTLLTWKECISECERRCNPFVQQIL